MMQDPSIPVNKKGILMSFMTGQPMPIPEKDNVSLPDALKLGQ